MEGKHSNQITESDLKFKFKTGFYLGMMFGIIIAVVVFLAVKQIDFVV